MLTVGSLFAGIGGFDLGLERAGMQGKWQVEIDSYCWKVLEKHWPHVRRYTDITTVDWSTVEPVDLVCGGFPCQPVSVAGKRKGTADERWFWPEFVRCIGVLRPRYILIENVPGLLTANDGLAFAEVLRDVAACGYDAEWDCIPLSAFGALHQRDRFFLVAYASSVRRSSSSNIHASHSSGRIQNKERNMAQAVEERRLKQSRSVENASTVLADDRQERTKRFFTEPPHKLAAFSWCQNIGRVEDLRGRSDISEPLIRGSADGIPDWVDRVGAIGNSVDPQRIEWIGRQLIRADAGR